MPTTTISISKPVTQVSLSGESIMVEYKTGTLGGVSSVQTNLDNHEAETSEAHGGIISPDVEQVADKSARLALTSITKGYRVEQTDLLGVVWEYHGTDPSDENNWRGYVNTDSDGQLVGPVINRAATDTQWQGVVLYEAEIGYATDTKVTKVGDGVTAWESLNSLASSDDLHTQNTDTGTTNDSFVVNSGSQVSSTAAFGSIQAGVANNQSGGYSTQSGYNNTQSGYANTQFGMENTQSGYYGIQAGTANTQGGSMGIQVGSSNTQNGSSGIQAGIFNNDNSKGYILQHGSRAVAQNNYQYILSSGRNAVDGDAQSVIQPFHDDTIHGDDAWKTINITGIEKRHVQTNSSMTLRAIISGSTAGATKTFSFEIKAAVANVAGTTSIKAQSLETLHTDDADFDCQLAVDTNELVFQVKDSTSGGDTVYWAATWIDAEAVHGV